MQPRKPLANSLEARGLQRFMDEDYYLYGGYVKLVQMFEEGKSNADIGRQFGPPDRPVTGQGVGRWRQRWEFEKEVANDPA